MKKQYAFYFDSTGCSGCKACQAACKDKNNLEAGVLWRRVYEVTGGEWEREGNAWKPNIFAYNISMSCNHCENAICVKSCPTKAMHKVKNGLVLVDESKCIGCRYCEWACPYGAPQYDEIKGVMSKCNFCYDFIEDDKNPACVSACPMRTLEFGELSELKKKYGDKEKIFPLPEFGETKPSVIINPHPKAAECGSLAAIINNKEEV